MPIPTRLIPSLALVFALTSASAGQTVVVTGAGSASANGDYKYLGDINSKPAYQQVTISDFELAWSVANEQWEIYNTSDGQIYYTNKFEIGTWVPRLGWSEDFGSSPPPILSGSGTKQPLDGTYTVGGGGVYGTIAEAVDSLNSNGILDEVTFLIAPGAYDEQIVVSDYVNYGQPSDGVAFKPNSGLVTWSYTGVTGAGDNFFVKIIGATNIRFEEIYFLVPGAATTFGRIIEYSDVENLEFSNCAFEGIPAPSDVNGDLIHGSGTNSGILIELSSLTGGYRGFSDEGDTDDLTISNTDFLYQVSAGIYITDADEVTIEGNSVEDAAASDPTYVAIDYRGLDVDLIGNDVRVAYGTGGMDLRVSLTGPTFEVVNNAVSMSSSSATYGMYVPVPGVKKILHNTVRMTAAAPSVAPALYIQAGSVEVKNNILVHEGGGPALRSATAIAGTNHNNYWTSGPWLIDAGSMYATLEDYQNAVFQDLQSVSIPVTFVSASDLHLAGSSDGNPKLIAPPLGSVTDDIDGDTRGIYNVIMGSDEATPLPPLDNDDTASGFYRVGGSMPYEFDDPGEALDHLNRRGIKDPVTLKIRNSGGPWKVNSVLDDFSRFDGSDTDSVIVTSDNPGNPAVLEYGQTSVDDNYLIKLEGAHDIELRDLVFQSTSESTFGTLIHIQYGENISVRGSEFRGLLGTSATVTASSIYVPLGTDSLTISDNYFFRSRQGIEANNVADAEYTDNTFRATFRGIWAIDHHNAVISGNRLDSLNVGIRVFGGGSLKIEANRADSAFARDLSLRRRNEH